MITGLGRVELRGGGGDGEDGRDPLLDALRRSQVEEQTGKSCQTEKDFAFKISNKKVDDF